MDVCNQSPSRLPRFNTKNDWCSVATHFQDRAGSILLLFLTLKPGNTTFMDVCNQSPYKVTQDAKSIISDTALSCSIWMGQWPCCCPFCLWRLPIHRQCITARKFQFNHRAYSTNNRWCSVDIHFIVLFIQNLLPLKIGFRIIWIHWWLFCLIVTWPFGKTKPSNIVAPVALILLKFIHLAK